MKVLCPACNRSVSIEEGTRSLVCGSCGAAADLSQIATSPGPVSTLTRDLSGDTLGDYRIDELLGVGGMGVVYKGRRIPDDRVVAVKVLGNVGFVKHEEFVARFRREVKALERLDHPNIVKILDSGEQGDIHYLVTEYVPGVSLAQYLKAKRLEIAELMAIMVKVSEAITFAHRNGIVHRDIKPANVIVDGDAVKVLDFGLAQITGMDAGLTTLTRTNLAMGTFNYLSPEQRTDAKSVDERSDVFSLGVVFFEMLTGTLPLGNFEPPSKLNRAVDRRVDRVVEKSLRSDPGSRYQSVDAFRDDIVRIQTPGRKVRPAVIAATLAICLGLGAAAAWSLLPRDTVVDEPAVIAPAAKEVELRQRQKVEASRALQNAAPITPMTGPEILPAAPTEPVDPEIDGPAQKADSALSKNPLKTAAAMKEDDKASAGGGSEKTKSAKPAPVKRKRRTSKKQTSDLSSDDLPQQSVNPAPPIRKKKAASPKIRKSKETPASGKAPKRFPKDDSLDFSSFKKRTK